MFVCLLLHCFLSLFPSCQEWCMAYTGDRDIQKLGVTRISKIIYKGSQNPTFSIPTFSCFLFFSSDVYSMG